MHLRPATAADRDAVLAVALAEETAWLGEPQSAAHDIEAWIDEGGGLGAGVVAVDGDGRVAGFAAPGGPEGILMADPVRTDALVDALLPWLASRRTPLELTISGADEVRVAAFARHGLVPVRSSFTLARPGAAGPLPLAEVPIGVAVAPYALGTDDEAVHRLIYVDAAWASVPGHAERDTDAWRRYMATCPWLLLARSDGRPVGWAAGHRSADGRGDVAQLAVADGERGRGLGRALLLSMGALLLAEAGVRDLTLGVQAHNEHALGLYRSAGFTVEHEWRVFSAPAGAR